MSLLEQELTVSWKASSFSLGTNMLPTGLKQPRGMTRAGLSLQNQYKSVSDFVQSSKQLARAPASLIGKDPFQA
jgi:hypothetical protein